MPVQKRSKKIVKLHQPFTVTLTFTDPITIRCLKTVSAWNGIELGEWMARELEAHMRRLNSEIEKPLSLR
jgi:hypothetical protein